MKTCYACNGKLKVIKGKSYKYDESGLNVILYGVTQYQCKKCGEKSVDIPKISQLHRVIGKMICCNQKAFLTGAEIRFLRKDLHLKSKDFAKMLGVTPQAVSNWENGKKRIGETSDRLLRSLYFNFVSEKTDHAVSRSMLDALLELPAKRAEEKTLSKIELNPPDWTTDRNVMACPLKTKLFAHF